jgi:23S rRNA-/tRNA-specific pseudouridylate synthase
LIIAKSEAVRAEFGKLFADRKIKKTYRALCFDTPPEEFGTIDLPIVQHSKGKNVYFAVKDEVGANFNLPVNKKVQSIKDSSAVLLWDNNGNRPLHESSPRTSPEGGGGAPRGVPRPARTDYKVLESLAGKRISYLECYPHTGRPHQIRVHLRAIGNPVLGDKIYAEHLAGKHPHYQLAPRQMLHAHKLEFEFRGKKFEVVSPIPADMTELLEGLRL